MKKFEKVEKVRKSLTKLKKLKICVDLEFCVDGTCGLDLRTRVATVRVATMRVATVGGDGEGDDGEGAHARQHAHQHARRMHAKPKRVSLMFCLLVYLCNVS